MRNGYVDLSFEVLDQLLKLNRAKIIGGTVVRDSTLRLFIVLDEIPGKFDKSWKIINIEDLIDSA
jgi:hypothetical protein